MHSEDKINNKKIKQTKTEMFYHCTICRHLFLAFTEKLLSENLVTSNVFDCMKKKNK